MVSPFVMAFPFLFIRGLAVDHESKLDRLKLDRLDVTQFRRLGNRLILLYYSPNAQYPIVG